MSSQLTKEAFARLFAENHHRVFGFVRSLVPHLADAEEVFQETCVVLWREFEQFDGERPFAPSPLGRWRLPAIRCCRIGSGIAAIGWCFQKR